MQKEITLLIDDENIEKIDGIIKLLEQGEAAASAQKIINFLIREINPVKIADKMLVAKKTHDEIIKKANERAKLLWD